MNPKNVKAAVAVGIVTIGLAIAPLAAFADDEPSAGQAARPTQEQAAAARLQMDLQSLVDLSSPGATVTFEAINTNGSPYVDASISMPGDSPAMDTSVNGALIAQLVQEAPATERSIANADAAAVRFDDATLLRDLPIVGQNDASPSMAAGDGLANPDS